MLFLLIGTAVAALTACTSIDGGNRSGAMFTARSRVLDFPIAGFSIPVLDFHPAPATESSQIRLVMYVGDETDFNSNVNVMIQDFSGTIDEYKELSESQYRDLGWDVLRSEIIDGAYYVEVSGGLFHYYAKGISNGSYVYLATGTSRADDWLEVRDAIVTVVDGLIVH